MKKKNSQLNKSNVVQEIKKVCGGGSDGVGYSNGGGGRETKNR